MGGRAPPRKKPKQSSRSHSPGAVHGSPAQLHQPTPIIAGNTRPSAGIDLGLLHPAAQRIPIDTQLLTDPATGAVTDNCS